MVELTRQSPEQVVAPIHSKTMSVILNTDEGAMFRCARRGTGQRRYSARYTMMRSRA
jgi:hypothetical protein